MAKNNNRDGWIKLHRKSMDSDVWPNPHLWQLWCYCLLKANHGDNKANLKGIAKAVPVKRGQFITGRRKIHKDLYPKKKKHRPDARTVWRRLKQLEQMGNVAIETKQGKPYSLVTVVNYKAYQSAVKSVQVKRQKRPSENGDKVLSKKGLDNSPEQKCPSETAKVSTNKKVFNKKYSPTSDEVRLSNLLFSEIRKRKPNLREPNIQKWAKHIDRLIRLDKRTPERIEAVIRWCQQHDFWQNNILSTEKLRIQIDQLELKMDKQTTPATAPLKRDASGRTPREAVLVQGKSERNQEYAK